MSDRSDGLDTIGFQGGSKVAPSRAPRERANRGRKGSEPRALFVTY